jgi:hypothetical protein
VEHFLFDTQRGDCTEFSHSAALLGRIAGIPSRVVTGYLASRDLQTNAHREGIFELQQVHSELASFNPSELYMVTTAHRHAWVQFYLPNHGWVDYEATAYAIPPSPGTDMNQRDVVIPQLTPMNSKNLLVNLPWKKMGRVFLLLILSALTFQFLRRRIAMGRLNSLSKGEDERALKAIYSLMIQRYNGRVKNPKDPSLTPKEMAKQWEQLKDFARIYEVTLYNPALSKDQYQDHLGFLRRESQRLIKDYSRAEHLLRGLFSLREVQ